MEKLTEEMAIVAVADIMQRAGDYETAHIREDALHQKFVACVAAGMYDMDEAVKVADIIKHTTKINFPRFYA